MKIGIDARLYGTRHGGIGRYTEQLLKHLEKADTQNQYVVFLQKDEFDGYQPKNPNFSKVLADFKAYSGGEQLKFPQLLKKHNLDFVHFTHFNVPLFYNQKFIVTIHDLIISHFPDSRATTLNPIKYKLKLLFYNAVIKHSAEKAEKIIAVSKYTKDDTVKLLKVDPNKITVTYEGVDFKKLMTINCQEVLNKKNIGKNFLLYVGSAYPHKNLEKLVSAFSKIQDENLQLVLAGREDYFYKRLKKRTTDKRVIFFGYASDEELVCLYKNAKLYVFPSLIEGFGLPPLEAQAYDLPVVSSNKTCLPEILGDGAIYFDPENPGDIAEKIKSVINNTDLQTDLIQKGKQNLQKYSWDKCADETLAVYQQ